MQGLWFSRVARTVSHELGHCMCLGHCVYYACLMQSTAGIAEDVRQPPYLCPVCMSKISYKANVELLRGSEENTQAYLEERYSALMSFCERWNKVGMFAGYQAWLKVRLEELASQRA
jgi:archaemetzincin